jgi:hypothetical protein
MTSRPTSLPTMPRLSWTQPSCEICWLERNPDRRPTTLKEPFRETEICCFCGEPTRSGIYVRVDPTTVLYPALKED